MEMRQKSMIMQNESQENLDKRSGDSIGINTAILVELLLDIRQISAAQFVIANGGTLPTPTWLEDIAKGV